MNDESFESAASMSDTWEIPPMIVQPKAVRPEPPVPPVPAPDLKRAPRTAPTEPDKLPPNSAEAEAGVLGCCLTDPINCLPSAVSRIASPLAFFDLRNQMVFDCLRSMSKDGTPVDLISVMQWLKDHALLEETGGATYLNALQDAVPSVANLSYYLDILVEKHYLRTAAQNCLQLGNRIIAGGFDLRDMAVTIESDLRSMAQVLDGKNGHLPGIIHASDFIKSEIIPPPELIKGLLHQGTKLVLGGGSKSFKTWLQLDLAISVATGVPWMGFDTVQGRVLFVNLEIQSSFFQQRLMQVAYSKGVKIREGGVDLWNLRGYSSPYHVILPKIIDRIKAEGYSLIVIDPIYKLYGDTDENSAGEVALLLNALETICTTTQSAVAFGAHFSKGNQAGKEAIDRISGSGVFARDPDSIIPFTRHEEEEAFVVEPILRNLPPIDPFVVRWEFPLMRRADNLDPDKLKAASGRPKEHSADEVFSMLPEGGLSASDWEEKSTKNLGISRRTFFRLKSELVSRDMALHSKIDNRWKPVTSRV